MEVFLGMISIFGFNFPPRGWAFCAGQILSIAQNTALFSLLGTQYGGNGQTTFALPDLRGRTPIGQGQGPGLSNYTIGQVSGTETSTLTINQLPGHSHTLLATTAAGDTAVPTNKILSASPSTGSGPNASSLKTYSSAVSNTQTANSTNTVGGSQPFSIIQPYLTLNYSIALEGIFPSRN
jgi:microcystin-dependent protein